MNELSIPRHKIVKVRRETRRRLVTVAAIEQIAPKLRRIRFASPELQDFESAGFDDHVKLFVRAAGGEICMRDYTPRAFAPADGTLVIDFALHEAGPATAWAMSARPGDVIQIGGPRGSIIVPDDFDWYLLVGDETAIPAMGRLVESLRHGVPVTTIIAVDGAADEIGFATRASWQPVWATRSAGLAGDADLLRSALAKCAPLPPGDGYIWIAAEARAARAVRTHVLETLGHPKAWVKAAGYWTSGLADAHEAISD